MNPSSNITITTVVEPFGYGLVGAGLLATCPYESVFIGTLASPIIIAKIRTCN